MMPKLTIFEYLRHSFDVSMARFVNTVSWKVLAVAHCRFPLVQTVFLLNKLFTKNTLLKI